MKVKDLIKKLEQFDPELVVTIDHLSAIGLRLHVTPVNHVSERTMKKYDKDRLYCSKDTDATTYILLS